MSTKNDSPDEIFIENTTVWQGRIRDAMAALGEHGSFHFAGEERKLHVVSRNVEHVTDTNTITFTLRYDDITAPIEP
jgi:hypothetical protein